MSSTTLRPAGTGRSSFASRFGAVGNTDFRTASSRYVQKLRDYFGWNVRNRQQSAACTEEIEKLQQELQRLQQGSAEHARTQKKLMDTQIELERIQMESADSSRRYASELQQLKADADTARADHEAEIKLLKANEARLIQDIQAGGDASLAGAYSENTRLQGLLSETQRALTQKTSELTRATSDFANQTASLKASYDAQIASINRDLGTCQSNFKKLSSDFTALNSAYTEQNSSILGSLTGFESKVKSLTQQFGDVSTSLSSLEKRFTTQETSTNTQIAAEKTERVGYVDGKINTLKSSLKDLFESRLTEERAQTNSDVDAKVEKSSFSLSKSFDNALADAQSVYDDKIKGALETARAVSKGDIALATQQTVDSLSSKLDTTSSGLQSFFESKLADERSATNTQFESERTERTGLFAGVDNKMDSLKSSLKDLFESRLTEERAQTNSDVDAKVEKSSFSLSRTFDNALADAQSVYDDKIKGALETARAVSKGDIALATQQTVDSLGEKLDMTRSGLLDMFNSKIEDERTQTDTKIENERSERQNTLASVASKFDETVQAARDASKGDFSSLKELFEDKIASERAATNSQFEKESSERSSGFLGVASQLSSLQSAVDAVRDASKGDFSALRDAFEDKISSERTKTDAQISEEKTERKAGFLSVASNLTSLKEFFEDKLASERALTTQQVEGETTERKSGILGLTNAIDALDLKYQTAIQAAKDASKGDFSGLQEVLVGKIADERTKTDAQIATEQSERKTGLFNLASNFDDKLSSVMSSVQTTFDGKLASERETTDAQISTEKANREKGLFGLASNLDSKFEIVKTAIGTLEDSFGTKIENERAQTDSQIANEQAERTKGFSGVADALKAIKDASQGDFSTIKDLISSERAKTDAQIADERSERATGFLNVSNALSSFDSKFEASIEAAKEASKGDFSSLKSLFEDKITSERATTDAQIAAEETQRKSGLSSLSDKLSGSVSSLESAVQAARDASAGDFSSLKDFFNSKIESERATTDNQIAAEETQRKSGLLSLSDKLSGSVSSLESAVQAARDASAGDFSNLKSFFEDKIASERTTTNNQIAAEETQRKSAFLGLTDKMDLSVANLESAVQAARDASSGDFSSLKALFDSKIVEERATTDAQFVTESKNTDNKVAEASTGLKSYFSGALDNAQTLYDTKISTAIDTARAFAKGDIAIATKETMDSIQTKLDSTASKVKDAFDNQLDRITGLESFQTSASKALNDYGADFSLFRSNIENQFSTVGSTIDDIKTKYTTIEAKFDSSFAEASTRLNSLDTSMKALDASTTQTVTNLTNRLEETVNTATKSMTEQFGLSLDVLSSIVNVNTQTFKVALENKIDDATSSLGTKLNGLGVDVDSMKTDFSSKFTSAFSSIDGLTSGLQDANNSITSVVNEVKTVAGKFDDVSNALGSVTADFKSKFGSIDATIDTLDKALAGRIDTVHGDVKATAGAVSTLESSFNKQVSTFQADLQMATQAAEKATNDLAASTGKSIAALEEDAKTVVNRAADLAKSALESRFTSIEKATTALENEASTVVDRAAKETSSRLNDRFSDLESATTTLKAKTETVVDDAVAKAKTQLESRFSTLESSTNELKTKTATVVDDAVTKAKSQLENRFSTLESSTNELKTKTATVVDDAVTKAKSQLETRFATLETSTKLLANNGKVIVDDAVKQAKAAAETRLTALESSTTLLANNGKVIVDDAVKQAKAAAETRLAALESSTTLLANNGKVIVDDAVKQAKAAAETRLTALESSTTLLANNGKVLVDSAVTQAKAAAETRLTALESSTTLLANNGKAIVDNAVTQAKAAAETRLKALESSTALLANNGKAIVDTAVTQAAAAAENRFKSLESSTALLANNGKAIVDTAVTQAKAAAETRLKALESSTALLANNGKALIDSSVTAAEAAFKTRLDSLAALRSRIDTSSDDLIFTAGSGRAVIAASSSGVSDGPALEVELDRGEYEEDDLMDAWESSVQSNFNIDKVIMPGAINGGGWYMHIQSPRENRLPFHWVQSWNMWVAMIHYKWANSKNLETTAVQTVLFTSPDGQQWTNRGSVRTSGPVMVDATAVTMFIVIDFVEDLETGTIVGIGSTGLDMNTPVTFRGSYDPAGTGAFTFTASRVLFTVGDVATKNNVKDASAKSLTQSPAVLILTGAKSALTAVPVPMYLTDITYGQGVFIAVGTAIMPAKYPSGFSPFAIEGTMLRSTDGINWTSVGLPAAGLLSSDPWVVYGDHPASEAVDSSKAFGAIPATAGPAVAAVPAGQKGIYMNLTSVAYSPPLDRWVAHDSRGLQFFVSNDSGMTWTLYASTSQTQANVVGKGLVYGSNVSTMWSSVLGKFILSNPDAGGAGSTYLESSDGIQWTHLGPMFRPGIAGGFLPRPAGSASHFPALMDAQEIGMFAILYTDAVGIHSVYTRDGTTWKEKQAEFPAGQSFTSGITIGWSPKLYQTVMYGLASVSNPTGAQIFSRFSELFDKSAMARRAPVRLGTTTNTGLALYSGTDRPQLVVLPEEGGVEIQNRLVIGNTVITEAQLARLLQLIRDPEPSAASAVPTQWDVTIEVEGANIYYSPNKPLQPGLTTSYKDTDVVKYLNGLGLTHKGAQIVFKSSRSTSYFNQQIGTSSSFLRFRLDSTKKVLGATPGVKDSGIFSMQSGKVGTNQVYQDAKDNQKRTLKSLLNNPEALRDWLG
jgi:hypothetical protein